MTQKRRKKKSSFWKILFLILLIAGGVICYFVWDSYFRDKDVDSDVTEVVEQKPKEEKKKEKIEITEVESEPDEVEVVEKEKVEQYDGPNPNEANELTGVITYVGVVNGSLLVRVNIDQYLASGSCNLILSRDGEEIYGEVVEVMNSASTATCAGFNVSGDKLGHGATDIVIKINADGKTGKIEGKVDI